MQNDNHEPIREIRAGFVGCPVFYEGKEKKIRVFKERSSVEKGKKE